MIAVLGAAAGPVAYAFTLGLVAAVNPCGFPLFPAYLAAMAGKDGAGWARRSARALASGACVSGSFVGVFAVLGLLVDAGLQAVMGWVPWLMLPISAALLCAGLLALAGRRLPRLPAPIAAPGETLPGVAMFGAAYAVASLSCTLPLFLAAVAASFTRLGVIGGTETFVAYGLGTAVLLTSAGIVAAHAGAGALRGVRAAGRFAPRLGGAVLAAAGAYLLVYWVGALTDPLHAPGLVRAVESAQAAVASWLAGHAAMVAAALGLLVVAALAALAASRPARAPGAPQPRTGAGPWQRQAPGGQEPTAKAIR